jgi:L-ascorbate metabolism protein UlaG (beta-lactamase superfamily)
LKERSTAASGRSSRGAVRAFFNLPLRDGQVGVLPLLLSAILVRTMEHVLAFDLGLFTIRRREIDALERVDAQFTTHIHFDHWSARLTRAIHVRTGAPAIVEPQVADRGRLSAAWVTSGVPDETIVVDDMRITPITGRHSCPISLFHVVLPELTLFHGGDSGHVPLDHLSADLAFVPVGGPAPSCTPRSGAAIVRDLRPKIAVPMHGFASEKRALERLVRAETPDTRVVIARRRVPFVLDL